MAKETIQNDRIVKTYIDSIVEIISKAKIEKNDCDRQWGSSYL